MSLIKIIHILLFVGFSGSLLGQSANFTTDLINNESCGAATVTFTISNPIEGNTYEWNFGNGEPNVTGTINGTNKGTASTTYYNSGVFTAQLTMNSTESSVQVITIHAIPEPSFEVIDGEGCFVASKAVTFNYTGTNPDYGANVTSWKWSFGDGSEDVVLTGSGNTVYKYTDFGTFNVLVEVVDENGCKASAFEPNAAVLYSTPHADFEINYDASCNFPLDIELTDKSTDGQNGINKYFWSVEKSGGQNIEISSEQKPVISLPSGGNYDITLTVSKSPGECIDQVTKVVSFQDNIVSFSPNIPQVICQGQEVTFTDNSVEVDGGTPLSYLWDFGDGITSTDKNPKHTYNDISGSPYTVTLFVTFSNGCQSSKVIEDLVTVNPATPPGITVDKPTSCKDYAATFTATPGFVFYEWDFDYDGQTPNLTLSGVENVVTKTYSGQKDSIQVYLQVTTSGGCVLHTVYQYIDILYPHADFVVSDGDEGCVMTSAQFDASLSGNQLPGSNNGIIQYVWDFENDGIDDYTSTSPLASHAYNDEGIFDVKLTIETATGCLKDTVIEKVVKRGYAPVASFTLSHADECRNTPVVYKNTSVINDAGTFPIDSLYWHLGDGFFVAGNPIERPGLNNHFHRYHDDTRDNGVPFTVWLKAFSNGCQSNVPKQEVEIAYPIARFELGANDDCGVASIHDFIAFDLSDPNRLSEGVEEFRWDFGDGSYYPGPTADDWETGINPSVKHQFRKLGIFDVTLFVRNNAEGCVDKTTHEVQMIAGALDFKADKTQICYNTQSDRVTFKNLTLSTSPSTSYTWDFGEGADPQTYDGATPPPVLYTTSGLKTVTLVLDEGLDCVRSLVKEGYIDARGPVVDFIWDSSNVIDTIQCLDPLQQVNFTSITNGTPNLNNNVIYDWSFGAGANPPEATRNSEVPISVSYTTSGDKDVTLRVVDNKGCSKSITKQAVISVPNPKADFDVNAVQNYCIGEGIYFKNKSSDTAPFFIEEWVWDFGDGATPATYNGEKPPNVTYNVKGKKTVTLMVTNNTGCTNIFTEEVDIYEANASFTVPAEIGCAPAEASFTDTSEDIVEWSWIFNDGYGSSSNRQNPSQLFLYPGIYDVSLTTTSKGGCKTTIEQPAALTVEGSFYKDFTATITPNYCLDSPDDPVVEFVITGLTETKYVTLDFGDGTEAHHHVFEGDAPVAYTITHQYKKMGSFQPKLTLEDERSALSCGPFVYIPEIDPITISEKAIPAFEVDVQEQTGCQYQPISFRDITKETNGIVDSRYKIVSWLWEFGDSANSTSGEQNPSFVYIEPGVYTVTMTVTTEVGCVSSVSQEVTVATQILDLTEGSPFLVCATDAPLLDGATPTGGVGEYSYKWQESLDANNWNDAPGTNDSEDYQVEIKDIKKQTKFYYRRVVTSGDCLVESPYFEVTIDPTTNPGMLSGFYSVCYNDNSQKLVLRNSIGQIKEWHSSTVEDFSTYTVISNTKDHYTPINLIETTYFRVLVQSGLCEEEFSNSVRLTVLPEITGNVIGEGQSLCSHEAPALLTATAPIGGEGNFTYQWQNSVDNITFKDIVGAVDETYQPSPLSHTTYFRRVVVSDNKCELFSKSLEVFITKSPDNSLPIITSATCEISDAEVIIRNTEVGITYYLLDIDDGYAEIVSGNGNGDDLTLIIPNSEFPAGGNSMNIQVRADNNGQCSRELANVTIRIDKYPNIYVNVINSEDVCAGTDAVITIESSVVGETYSIIDFSNENIVVVADGNGNNLDLVIPASKLPTSGRFSYGLNVSHLTCSELLYEGSFGVIPGPDNRLTVSDPFICAEASPANTFVQISGSETGVRYQLRLDSDNSVQGDPVIGNGNDISLQIVTPATTTVYNVFATSTTTDGQGEECDGLMLIDKAVVTIVPVPNQDNEVTDPVICYGDDVNVLVKNSQEDVKYTLRLSGVDIQSLNGTGGDITFAVIPPPTTNTTYQVFAQSVLNGGSCGEVQLVDDAQISVIQVPETDATVSDVDICQSGNDVIITVNPTDITVNYELRELGGVYSQVLSGTGAELNFSLSEPSQSGVYEVYATPIRLNSEGNACNTVKLIDVANLNFVPTPDVALVVSGDKVCEGNQGLITIESSEIKTQYQLRENGGGVMIGSPVEGTGGTIQFAPLVPVSSTIYEVVATSTVLACPEVILQTKPEVTVIRMPRLDLAISPTTASICYGESHMISVNGTETGIRYQLRIGNENVEGQVFDGDKGLAKSFNVTPLGSTTYNVLATPIDTDKQGASCDGLQMDQLVDVIVEGPVTIEEQPFDTHICSGSEASFYVKANSGETGTLNYQWRMDGNPLTDGGNISGSNTATLTIKDVSGLDFGSTGTAFDVLVKTDKCVTVISEVANIYSSSPPDPTDFVINGVNICQGNDAIVSFSSMLANSDYRFSYNLVGANSASNMETIATVTSGDGMGTFIVPASELVNIGSTAIIVTQLDYARANDCVTGGLAVSDIIEVEKKPDITDFNVAVDNICHGQVAEVSVVSSGLETNIYEVNYNISGANTGVGLSSELLFEAGRGVFEILSSNLVNTGVTTIEVINIENTLGEMCGTLVDIPDLDFTVEPNPVIEGLLFNADNICLGTDAVVNITGGLIDGEYQLTYNLSGASNSNNNIATTTIQSGNGTGQFVIPDNLLKNTGNVNVLVTDIAFVTGKKCPDRGLNIGASFNIEPVPDVGNLSVITLDICEGESLNVLLTSNLNNGDYRIRYQVNGANNFYDQIEDLTISTGDGNVIFTIPSSMLPNPGLSTITIREVIDLNSSQQCSEGLYVQNNFTIETSPIVDGLVIEAANTCLGQSSGVNVISSLDPGVYQFSYELSGSGNLANVISLVEIFNDGTGAFVIPGFDLTTAGITTITVNSIKKVFGLGCEISGFTVSDDFIVENLPNITSLQARVEDVCLYNNASVTVQGLLDDGQYEITYELLGNNMMLPETEIIDVTAGVGNFSIDSADLPNEGPTVLHIFSIRSIVGEMCEGAESVSVKGEFSILPLPVTEGFKIHAIDACSGSDVKITAVSNLLNGSYEIQYYITGKNEVATTKIIDLATGDGDFEFVIPAENLPNIGSNTIWVTNIKYLSGKQCEIDIESKSNFTISRTPDISGFQIKTVDICQEQSQQVAVTSQMEDGLYEVVMDITGDNPNARFVAQLQLVNGDGSGVFIIPSGEIPNVGINKLTVLEIIDVIGAGCGTPVVNVESEFNIEAIPLAKGISVKVESTCQGRDARVDIGGSLLDGNYVLTYELTGANTISSQAVNLSLQNGDGTTTFMISSNLLPNEGATNIVLTSIAYVNGLGCSIPINLLDDFQVVSIGGTFDGEMAIDDICNGKDAVVSVTTSLPNGEYRFDYNLIGANTVDNLSAITSVEAGACSFNIPKEVLLANGHQIFTVTTITILGIDGCEASGVGIERDFMIDGPVEITQHPVPDDKCSGETVSYTAYGENLADGDILYRWMASDDGGTTYEEIIDQGGYSGSHTETLVIANNTLHDTKLYKIHAFTTDCDGVESDPVLLTVLKGSVCGEGLENLPDAITPNGDGVNDYWWIEGAENYPNNHVQVFNRWGALVYESNAYNNTEIRFEGISNKGSGKELPDGTYFFIINLGDGSSILKGYLVINR